MDGDDWNISGMLNPEISILAEESSEVPLVLMRFQIFIDGFQMTGLSFLGKFRWRHATTLCLG